MKKQNVIVESLSKNNTYLIHRQYILITSNILNSCSIYMSPYLRLKNEWSYLQKGQAFFNKVIQVPPPVK